MSYETIGMLNVAVSWGLVVLIWLVQIIIYPVFREIPKANFPKYHRWYAVRICFFVIPLMAFEIIVLVSLALKADSHSPVFLSMVTVGVVWLSTFLMQVPIHRKLGTAKDGVIIDKLIKTNWIRTTAWSIKAVYLTVLL